MAEPKTKPTDQDVRAFLAGVANPQRRANTETVVEMMASVTGEPPVMWGNSIVGFGSYHYRYASGREGYWMAMGVSPRKQALTLYLMDGFENRAADLERLGPHAIGKSCLYIKRLDAIDLDALRELLESSAEQMSRPGND